MFLSHIFIGFCVLFGYFSLCQTFGTQMDRSANMLLEPLMEAYE